MAGLLYHALGVGAPAMAADNTDVQDMRRAIQELMAKNRELSERLSVLEAGQKAGESRRRPPAPSNRAMADEGAITKAAPKPRETHADTDRAPPAAATAGGNRLEQRVTDLELARTAQESAVRSIIQDSFAKTGSKINEFVTLGGAIEVVGGRSSDFTGTTKDKIFLNTAELDLEVKISDWVLGTLMLNYNDGSNALFPSNSGANLGIDRITVDKANVLIGDVQRFPIYVKAGRDVLPFGTSTGVHRSDVLSIDNPLTVEIFETRANTVGIGFALPTPAPAPPPAPFTAPTVRPLVINPLVSAAAGYLGYTPPPYRPKPAVPWTPPVEAPPFYGSLYAYDANVVENVNRRFSGSLNGRLGFQTRGTCGSSYNELKDSYFCPWAIDVSVDYLGSVFDSKFLQEGYSLFLPAIGKAPGMAASMKLSFGPFLLVTEWNGAIKAARFVDNSGRPVSIMPAAWAVSLAYQFDWNPWLDVIGSRGNYIAASYSRSHDMAGVISTAGITGTPVRVGSAPESRMTLTAAEWVTEGTRIIVEYSLAWDYATNKGGTGRQANGIFVALTYVW